MGIGVNDTTLTTPTYCYRCLFTGAYPGCSDTERCIMIHQQGVRGR